MWRVAIGELKKSAGCARPTGEDGGERSGNSAFLAESSEHFLMEAALSREASKPE
jgi:hypothetical protein